MQGVRNSILRHVRVNVLPKSAFWENRSVFRMPGGQLCTSATTETSSDEIKQRVIELVKKFDRIDSAKVTETADFQKDLSLDSLDRVELVMAFEEEFSIDIPEEKADKLTCCTDVARYIAEAVEHKAVEKL